MSKKSFTALGVLVGLLGSMVCASSLNAETLSQLKRVAHEGNANAELHLGMMYAKGDNSIPRNYVTADSWFEKAARQGNAHAALELANMYGSGLGVPTRSSKARYWYKRAIKNAHGNTAIIVTAESEMASIYQQDTASDAAGPNSKALYWTEKAAQNGSLRDESNLVDFYEFGSFSSSGSTHLNVLLNDLNQKIGRNYNKAVFWMKTIIHQKRFYCFAPNTGDFVLTSLPANSNKWRLPKPLISINKFYFAYAKFLLGINFFEGDGVPQNSKAAIIWIKQAQAYGGMASLMAKRAIHYIERGE